MLGFYSFNTIVKIYSSFKGQTQQRLEPAKILVYNSSGLPVSCFFSWLMSFSVASASYYNV